MGLLSLKSLQCLIKLKFQFETGLGAAGSAAQIQGQAMEKPSGSATTLHLMAEKTVHQDRLFVMIA